MKHILFVCTGNTCRSPMAEYLLRHKAGDKFEVKSAGIAAFEGDPAANHVHQLLAEKGVEVNHRSQNVSSELMEWADLILTMTEAHQSILQNQFPEKKDIICPLRKRIDPGDHQVNISDPFGGSLEVYRKTLLEMEELIDQLIKQTGNH